MIKKRSQKISLLKSKNLIYLLIFVLVAIVIFKVIIFPTHAPLIGHWSRSWVSDHWEYNCSNCSDCNDAIANASSGDIVQLNTSINNHVGTCIGFQESGGEGNITFDCQWYTIEGDYSTNWVGIYSNSSNDNTIKNCNMTGFYFGILISFSSNNTLTNIISDNSYYGISLSSSNNSVLTNITAENNSYYGIYSVYSNNSVLTNIITSSNLFIGIEFRDSNNNTITNITTNSNPQEGIRFARNSDYNIINNSHIENNTNYGLYFYHSAPNYPQYNLIYNNIINNTVNYYNTTNLTNYFNTTNTSGTNIVGGSWIGGNYWDNWSAPGTGFSETCIDTDGDKICDANYSLDGDNYDYLPLVYNLTTICTESWTYSAWSTCTGGTQTRTATDENDCGTTNDRLALSQSCTVGGGNGGGGITKDQPTESHIWTEITPDQPVEMIIDNPEIDLTKITIDVSETVEDASLTITKIDVVPIADIKIGMVGDTYQSFKIETTGINDTNIESAIIEFKVNKTWISEQGGSAGDIKLYRGGEKVNVWNELQTTLTDSDSDYYYFSAISPGLSIFIVVIDLSVCNNNNICETELGENEINCPNDCKIVTDDENKFLEIIKQPYLWLIIILILMIVMVLVVLIVRLKRNKRLAQMMEK